MTVYYVATTGNNQGSGSVSAPWRSINYATNYSGLKPGDEIVVKSGVYTETVTISKDGAPDAYITLRSEVPGGAQIRPPSNAYSTVNLRGGDYIKIEGFDVVGGGGHGIDGERSHHIVVSGNTVHDSGGSGISFYLSEFQTIENNNVYNNASSNGFHTSGISVASNINISGDTSTPGYRTIIRNNTSHNNVEISSSGEHTDGNGIIIDWFRNEGTGNPAYNFPTLVENNLVYENGGKGIQVFLSDNVTVSGNTAWHNNQDLRNPGTARMEISNQSGDNNTFYNNIAVADPTVNSNNTALSDHGGYNSNTVWYNNLTFNGTSGQASAPAYDGNERITATDGNLLGVNPMFVDPGSGDFRLKSGSPAIDHGTTSLQIPSSDLAGAPRVVGATVDIGAYEYGSAGTPPPQNTPPVARDDAGFTTQTSSPLAIGAAQLLANDSDANTDPLALTSVGSPVNGAVRIASDGNVVFTPTSGFDGTAGFSYTISDGKGGTASAEVVVTVSPGANAQPMITSGSSFALNENKTAVGAVTASDAEGDTLAFSKAGGADAALFAVNPTTGAISFLAAPDFENPKDADGNNVYQLVVGVEDASHAAVTKSLNITVGDVAEQSPPPPPPGETTGSSFFAATAKPAATETGDSTDYELGMRFRPTVDGEVTALRYYRGTADASDTDTRTLNLWSADGNKLASAEITSAPGNDGWQSATLSKPVEIAADELYVVSYGTTQNYADSQNFFGKEMTNADGTLVVASAAGVFSPQTSKSGPGYFPTESWHASNYWADVIFAASQDAPQPDPTPDSGQEPQVVVRWNAGTRTVGAVDGGPDWVADADAITGSAKISNMGGSWEIDSSVPDTTPVGIFNHENWGNTADSEMALAFGDGKLEDGHYAVRLYMGNGYAGTDDPGERVFDVSVEDQPFLDDIDLASRLGHRVGGMFEWTGIVDDGTVNIDFVHVVENPLINGVEILLLDSDM